MNYRGYYITETMSKQDIDMMILTNTVRTYKAMAERFANNPSMELSVEMDKRAQFLVKECGLTWDEVEALEIV